MKSHSHRTARIVSTMLAALLITSACDSVTGNRCAERTVTVQTGTLPGAGTSGAAEIADLRAQGWQCTDNGPAVGANGTVIGEQYSCRKC